MEKRARKVGALKGEHRSVILYAKAGIQMEARPAKVILTALGNVSARTCQKLVSVPRSPDSVKRSTRLLVAMARSKMAS
jgi:hypothetical protein